MANKTGKTVKVAAPDENAAKKYVSQTDVPAFSLDQAIRVPKAISDSLGKVPSRPLRVAQAMELSPASSGFRRLCGAAIAYGLTEGGYNSALIAMTPLAKRIVAPTKEGDDLSARREAMLRPRVVGDFLTRYNGSKVPAEPIARNVLEELGVPSERTAEVFALIVEGAQGVGFLQDVKGQRYVDLDSAGAIPAATQIPVNTPENTDITVQAGALETSGTPALTQVTAGSRRIHRVFITHGKNQEIVAQLKELLQFGGFTPVVALENETSSKPVPEKVLGDMRSCHAAVIHVGAELKLMDQEGTEHRTLNQNVLIEIGAAMALYGQKFILLVEKGVTLPSNLQGLYEVRHEGGRLNYDSTMKLLKAFNEFRL